jgi:hypothetical protein
VRLSTFRRPVGGSGTGSRGFVAIRATSSASRSRKVRRRGGVVQDAELNLSSMGLGWHLGGVGFPAGCGMRLLAIACWAATVARIPADRSYHKSTVRPHDPTVSHLAPMRSCEPGRGVLR